MPESELFHVVQNDKLALKYGIIGARLLKRRKNMAHLTEKCLLF